MAIIQRLINLQFQGAAQVAGLMSSGQVGTFATGSGAGVFGAGSNNFNATLSGLRTSVTVTISGGSSQASANFRVWGMPQDQMNQLSTLGLVRDIYQRSNVKIIAGDLINGMYQIFSGTIVNAWADYAAMPQVPFNVECATGPIAATMSTPPTSINGSGDAAGMIQKLARQAGFDFTNNGVNTKIRYPYFYGSPRDQMLAIVKASNIEWIIDNDVVAIWPSSGFRTTTAITISPGAGMVGYPSFAKGGPVVKILFNPSIIYGCQVTITGSSVTPANGTWKVYNLEHKLESMMPNGAWFTTLYCNPPGNVPGIPGVPQGQSVNPPASASPSAPTSS